VKSRASVYQQTHVRSVYLSDASESLNERTIPVITTLRSMSHRHLSAVKRDRILVQLSRSGQSDLPGSITDGIAALPSLYVLNASAITKPHAIEHLSADFTSYRADIAVISETHLKAKHRDQFAAVDAMFRRDRVRRRGGGVAVYVNSRLTAALCSFISDSPTFELMWVHVKAAGSRDLLVGALYHAPKPLYQPTELLDHLDVCIWTIYVDIARVLPDALVILAGDFNSLPDEDITARCTLTSIVHQPTRGASKLDKIIASDPSYSTVRVVTSTCKSDHKAIVAFSGSQSKRNNKLRENFVFRKRSPTQHALFLDHMSDLNITFDNSNDVQVNFDELYDVMLSLLDRFYPERSITVTSADPDFVTPTIKAQLRKKNRLMRAGRSEEAGALAKRIRAAIIRQNGAQLRHVDTRRCTKDAWAKVRQLTGARKNSKYDNIGQTAQSLNDHYAAVSSDVGYRCTPLKQTALPCHSHITEQSVFRALDHLRASAHSYRSRSHSGLVFASRRTHFVQSHCAALQPVHQ